MTVIHITFAKYAFVTVMYIDLQPQLYLNFNYLTFFPALSKAEVSLIPFQSYHLPVTRKVVRLNLGGSLS